MTGIRWTTVLDAGLGMVHQMDEQSDHDGRWRFVAEVISGELEDGSLGYVALDDAGNDIATCTTLAGAKESAESYLDARNEAAWESRNADPDVVTLREQAWADHQDSEVLHDRREVA